MCIDEEQWSALAGYLPFAKTCTTKKREVLSVYLLLKMLALLPKSTSRLFIAFCFDQGFIFSDIFSSSEFKFNRSFSQYYIKKFAKYVLEFPNKTKWAWDIFFSDVTFQWNNYGGADCGPRQTVTQMESRPFCFSKQPDFTFIIVLRYWLIV